MAPFVILVVSFIVFCAAGYAGVAYFDHWQNSLRAAVALMFLATASAHWGRRRPDLVRMVPPAFPNPRLLVTITGILEIAGAVGLVVPATSKLASTCLALMMLALFPANIRAARQGIGIGGRPATPLPLRAVLQIVFILATLAAGWSDVVIKKVSFLG